MLLQAVILSPHLSDIAFLSDTAKEREPFIHDTIQEKKTALPSILLISGITNFELQKPSFVAVVLLTHQQLMGLQNEQGREGRGFGSVLGHLLGMQRVPGSVPGIPSCR